LAPAADQPALAAARQAATLILAGDDDPIILPANARLMAAPLPDARLHVSGRARLLTRARGLVAVVAISSWQLNQAGSARSNESHDGISVDESARRGGEHHRRPQDNLPGLTVRPRLRIRAGSRSRGAGHRHATTCTSRSALIDYILVLRTGSATLNLSAPNAPAAPGGPGRRWPDAHRVPGGVAGAVVGMAACRDSRRPRQRRHRLAGAVLAGEHLPTPRSPPTATRPGTCSARRAGAGRWSGHPGRTAARKPVVAASAQWPPLDGALSWSRRRPNWS
jgi:hypothetical protein